jgi:hypothetical protein
MDKLMTEMQLPWPAGSQDAIGQAGELLIWTALITQSGGGLHVFLPTLDRGIDGLIHRLSDRAYLALQVKSKTTSDSGEASIAVLETHLFTNDQIVIGVHFVENRLGDYTLVADAATFRRKAGRVIDRGRPLLVADMPLRPIPGHKWSEDLVPTTDLATRLGFAPSALIAPPPAEAPREEDLVIGHVGELEVMRRLATLADCGLFRPLPDNEMAEVVIRRLATGRTVGIQVKTEQLDEPHAYRNVLVNRATFVPDPNTLLVALAWIMPEGRFHETCLLIPAEVLPAIAGTSGPNYELHFRPDGSAEPSKVDPYRIPIEQLAERVAGHLNN